MFTDEIVEKIKNKGIGIIPTDTMYGIVGSALNPETIEKIYNLRERDKNKPLIVLISSLDDIFTFNPDLSIETRKILEKIWPAPVSVILPVPSEEFDYISRGTKNIAMRLPESGDLKNLLLETGPLVAPSANLEGDKPAETISEAKNYFPNLDFYVDDGTLPNNPSTLIKIENSKAKVLRQGAWKVPDFLI